MLRASLLLNGIKVLICYDGAGMVFSFDAASGVYVCPVDPVGDYIGKCPGPPVFTILRSSLIS
jgi:hypothetical protein